MTRIAAPSLFQFRQADTENLHFQKLEALRRAIAGQSSASTPRTWYISFTGGLPDADPARPLLTLLVRESFTLGQIEGHADIVSAIAASIRFEKDGVDNGSVIFGASESEALDAVDSHYYPAATLLEIFPPSATGHTLDDVSLSIPITVG